MDNPQRARAFEDSRALAERWLAPLPQGGVYSTAPTVKIDPTEMFLDVWKLGDQS